MEGETQRRKGHPHRPSRTYGLLTLAFNAAAWSVAATSRRAPGLGDLLVLGVATQQVTRTVANDRVTSTVRRPFVDVSPSGAETPKARGPRRALGELLTCPYCLAPWTALALSAAYAVAPRATRGFASILTIAAVSDFANRAQAALLRSTSAARPQGEQPTLPVASSQLQAPQPVSRATQEPSQHW